MNNWTRWIYASASKVFAAAAAAYPIHFYLEGTKRDTDKKINFIEFRINGPRLTEISHNYYRLDLDINILYSVAIGSDFHLPYKITGMILNTMKDICIYKWNDGDALLGVLTLKRQPIMVSHFGQARADTEILQGTVEGNYVIYLSGE
jgi:hypothetical protein